MTELPSTQPVGELLEHLVAFETANPPGNEREAAQFLGHTLGQHGFSIELQDVGSESRANIIARLENGPGPALAFCSHLDVVPAGAGWSTDPFRLVEKDGRYFGRGACDAKGAVAAMSEGMMALAGRKTEWSGTLIGVFVADEEILAQGARDYVARNPRIDYVVVGEPTDNRIASAHKGCVRPHVRIHGREAHSGEPERGLNAIALASRFIGQVETLHADLIKKSHPLVGTPAITVTRMNGGTADNVVPANCDIVIDRRVLPGERMGDVHREFTEFLDKAAADIGFEAEILGYRSDAGPSETPASSPLVQTALTVCRANGLAAEGPKGFTGGCDLVHFRGICGEGIILGPGSLQVAHKPNEFVPISELDTACQLYENIAHAMYQL
ncbi:MAG: M20 family metallopeptidase [Alphaproteobacteria bacterium]